MGNEKGKKCGGVWDRVKGRERNWNSGRKGRYKKKFREKGEDGKEKKKKKEEKESRGNNEIRIIHEYIGVEKIEGDKG